MENRIRLRALTKNDITKTLEWHNQNDIRELYSGHPFPVNREMEEKWYEKILTSNFPTTVFGTELIKESELIGITVLKNIDLINRNAEFAIYIGNKEQRGKGYSKEALMKTFKFGLYQLGLERIYLKVLEENTVAQKLYTSCGLKKEGVLKNSVFKNDEFKNEIIFAIIKGEFKI